MIQIPQTTSRVVMLKLFLSSDHISVATGKTVAITISKNGGAFANPNAGATNATEVANGWYKVTLDTTDTGTVGDLVVRGTATSCDDTERVFGVVKATNGGLTALPDTAVTTNASLLTSGTGTDQLSVASGRGKADTVYWNASAVATPDTAGYPKVTVKSGTGTGEISLTSGMAQADVAKINGVDTSSVTTVSANIGTTQPINFTGTSSTAYVKTDVIDIAGTAQTAKDLGAINVTNLNTLSGHDPGTTIGTSTLTQTQVTGGAYALNSSSFAFNSALDFTTTQKTSLNAATPSVTVSDKTGFSLTQAFPANFADLAITSSTGRVTVGANADKTGYSLSQTFPSNFASLVISAGGVVSADAVSLSGDATAADNAESFFDGTGYAGTNNVIPTVTLVNTLTTYTGNTPQTGDAYAIVNSGTFGNAAIKGYVDDIGTAGAGLTAIPWNAAWDVEVQSEVQDAIEVNNLDHLVKVAVDTDFPTTVHLDSVIGYLADNGTTATFDRTTDALEAIRDRGDVAWTTGTGTSTLTAGDVSTAVWNAATASYGTAGTYGALVEANLDAAISSRSTYDGSDTSGTTTLLERVTATRAGYWDNLSAGAVALASGVTVTTNNDKTGYSLTVTPPTAAQVTTSVWSTLLSGSDFNTSGSIGKLLKDDVDTTISSRQATVSFPTNFSSLGINASGHVSRVTLADTTTTVTNAVTVGDVTLATIQPNYAPAKAGDAMTLTTGERGSIADAFLDRANGIETGITPRQAIRAMAAMLGGEISGVTAENGTVTVTIKAIGNNTVTRITMDTDELGNRSSITMS